MKQLIDEAIQFLLDHSKEQNDFMYQIATWDDETRTAFILAYNVFYNSEKNESVTK